MTFAADVDSGVVSSGSGEATRCLVVMVPGMSVTEPGQYLGKLIAGLREFADTRSIDLQEGAAGKGEHGQSVTRIALGKDTERVELEFVESYWSDRRPRLSAESGSRKLLGGLALLAFWMLSPKVWAQSLQRKYLTFWATGTLLLLMAWYYGAVVALFTVSSAELAEQFGLAGLAPALQAWGERLGGWKVWVTVSAVTAFFPMLHAVDVAHATMAYLQNQEGFANKVKGRLAKILYSALDEDFDRIVVVGHSFGVAVALESIAELDVDPGQRISLVTLGGSLGLLRARCPRLQAAHERLLKPGLVASWSDFWSDEDWLGTPALDVPEGAPAPGARLASHRLDATVSLWSKLSGESHGLYFSEPGVYEALLDQCARPPAGALAA